MVVDGEGRAPASSTNAFERGELLATLLPAHRAGEQRVLLAALQGTGEKGRRDPAVAYLQALVTASHGVGYDAMAAGQHLHRFLVLTRPRAPSATDHDDWAMLPFLRQFGIEGAESVIGLRLRAESLQRQIGAKADLPLVDFADYATLRTRMEPNSKEIRDAEKDVAKKEAAVERAKARLRRAEEEPDSTGGLFNTTEKDSRISRAKALLKEAQEELKGSEVLLAKCVKKADAVNARLRRYEVFRGERRPLAR